MHFSIWELLLLIIILVLIFLTIIKKIKIPSSRNNKILLNNSDIKFIKFIYDNIIKEGNIIISSEEIPLDNRFGNSPIISEHEFSKTITTDLKINKTNELNAGLTIKAWDLLETELRINLNKSIGIQIGGQVTRKVTIKLEAAPGKFVNYRLIWKQHERKGLANININNKQIELPYTTTYGLFHSIESISSI